MCLCAPTFLTHTYTHRHTQGVAGVGILSHQKLRLRPDSSKSRGQPLDRFPICNQRLKQERVTDNPPSSSSSSCAPSLLSLSLWPSLHLCHSLSFSLISSFYSSFIQFSPLAALFCPSFSLPVCLLAPSLLFRPCSPHFSLLLCLLIQSVILSSYFLISICPSPFSFLPCVFFVSQMVFYVKSSRYWVTSLS